MQLQNGADLPRALPSAQGVDPDGIGRFLDAVEQDALELHSLMVLKNGAVVAEAAYAPYRLDIPHMTHSSTKSWTATAVAVALDDGKLTLDDRVLDFFPEHRPAQVSDNLAAMTVRDLLTMRTGHRTGISGGEWRGSSESWIKLFLAEPVPDRPGDAYMYNSASSYILSAIVTKATGYTAYELLRERVMDPLGMGAVSWDVSPEGYNSGGNGITCTTEDMAKFGQLHLQNGVWNGQRILSEDWVREATRNQVREVWIGDLDGKRYTRPDGPLDPSFRRPGYGYHWWMTADGGYYASGLFGQMCLVWPALQAVVVTTAGLQPRDRRLYQAIATHLVPALRGGGGKSDATLATRLRSLALPDRPDGAPHAARADAISGRSWTVAPNEDGVTSVKLQFSDDRCVFTLTDARGTHRIDAGLHAPIEGTTTMTGAKLHHGYEPDSLRVVAQGAWATQDRFVMTWRYVETAFCDTVTCSFAGDELRLARSVNTNSSATSRPTLLGR
jgi:CubicO group peptidase (beta-lactamase class C family)